MERVHEYDRSSNWLIQHYGGSILRLAGIQDVESFRPLQAEVVQPRKLPDGLLEVRFQNDADPDLFLLELATYPERRVGDQLAEDLMLVRMDRGIVPEAVVVVLHPKGKLSVPRSRRMSSRRGLAACTFRWTVVELWKLPAADLLATGDAGLVPWVPLTRIEGPPEPVFQRCREIVDQTAPENERANLLAVTQILAGLRYNDETLLQILGDEKEMIESPVLKEYCARASHRTILRFLKARFDEVPAEVETELSNIVEEEELDRLADRAAVCESLDSFINELRAR